MIVPGDGVFEVRVHIGLFRQNCHQSKIFAAGRAKGPKALYIRDCHRTLGYHANELRQRFCQIGMRELKACLLSNGGNDAQAIEEKTRHLSKREVQRKMGNREEGGTMDGVGQKASEFRIRDGGRRAAIQRPTDSIIRGKQKETDEILDMNPRHPLLSAAETAADPEAERSEHLRERPTVASQDCGDANRYDTQAEFGGALRFAFPFQTNIGQKTGTRRTTFCEDLVAAIAIVADGRS